MADIKAVLFDLDDTLYDHRFSSRNGLKTLKNNFNCFKDIPLDELEKEYIKLLNKIHISKVLTGLYTIDEARIERHKIFFSRYGIDADNDLINKARTMYSDSYKEIQRAVPGAAGLLHSLKKKVKIGIISNNFGSEQQIKIDVCGFQGYFDVLVTSVEAGIAKPAREIFFTALKKLKCRADEAVMIGDSWESDIKGARNAGIRAIWFNRYGENCPETKSEITEISSLIHREEIERHIFSTAV